MIIVDLSLLWWLFAWAHEAFVENQEPSVRLKLGFFVSAGWFWWNDVGPWLAEWSRSV